MDPIQVRLDAIIGLLTEFLIVNGNTTNTSIYQSLDRVGLTPTEIGNIFGKNRSDIGSALNKAKKSISTKNSKSKGSKHV